LAVFPGKTQWPRGGGGWNKKGGEKKANTRLFSALGPGFLEGRGVHFFFKNLSHHQFGVPQGGGKKGGGGAAGGVDVGGRGILSRGVNPPPGLFSGKRAKKLFHKPNNEKNENSKSPRAKGTNCLVYGCGLLPRSGARTPEGLGHHPPPQGARPRPTPGRFWGVSFTPLNRGGSPPGWPPPTAERDGPGPSPGRQGGAPPFYQFPPFPLFPPTDKKGGPGGWGGKPPLQFS